MGGFLVLNNIQTFTQTPFILPPIENTGSAQVTGEL